MAFPEDTDLSSLTGLVFALVLAVPYYTQMVYNWGYRDIVNLSHPSAKTCTRTTQEPPNAAASESEPAAKRSKSSTKRGKKA